MGFIASASKTTAATVAIGLAVAVIVQLRRIRRVSTPGRRGLAASQGFEQQRSPPALRVLVLGDSTGVGVGAARPGESIAGLVARDRGDVEIVNRAASGARVADVLASTQQLRRERSRPFDIALLHAGGNDVLHATPLPALHADAERLLADLGALSRHTVWLGAANVGLAPLFLPPFSWWLSRRGRQVRAVLAETARRAGIRFLDFFHGRRNDPFGRDAERYYAPDRVHPSSASYAYCYRALQERTPFLRWLGRRPAQQRGPGLAGTAAAEPRPDFREHP